jgi:hypothetical protein
MLIHITDLLNVAAGDDTLENRLNREVRELADELNSALPDYEVRLVHLDTDDYLEFIKREPAEAEIEQA